MIDIIIELLFATGLFVNAILFIPQIIRLFQKKHSDDVSLITFAGFNLINLITVLHGLIKNDFILAIGSALALITNTTVTLLILWYRYRRCPPK